MARARRVILVGGGKIGVFVAGELEARGVRAKIIESDKDAAEMAANALDRTVVLHGDGLDRDMLHEAGVENAEVAISLTNDDKVNVLSSVISKREGAERTLCLINDRTYEPLKESLGVDVFIDPRTITVSTILQHVRRGRITELYSVEDGGGAILEGVALETSPLVGKTIGELDLPDGVVIGAVVRKDKVLLGREDVSIKKDDRVIVFSERGQISAVERMFRVSAAFF